MPCKRCKTTSDDYDGYCRACYLRQTPGAFRPVGPNEKIRTASSRAGELGIQKLHARPVDTGGLDLDSGEYVDE